MAVGVVLVGVGVVVGDGGAVAVVVGDGLVGEGVVGDGDVVGEVGVVVGGAFGSVA